MNALRLTALFILCVIVAPLAAPLILVLGIIDLIEMLPDSESVKL